MPAVALRDVLGKLEATDPRYATEVVERVLAEAQATGASDVHFQPGADALELRWRLDGVLHSIASPTLATDFASRVLPGQVFTERISAPGVGWPSAIPWDATRKMNTANRT